MDFYREVLGWEFTEPAAEFGGYTIGQIGDRAAARTGPARPDAPVAWTLLHR